MKGTSEGLWEGPEKIRNFTKGGKNKNPLCWLLEIEQEQPKAYRQERSTYFSHRWCAHSISFPVLFGGGEEPLTICKDAEAVQAFLVHYFSKPHRGWNRAGLGSQ